MNASVVRLVKNARPRSVWEQSQHTQGTDTNETHELGPESPAAVAGNNTRGHIQEAGDACEGGGGEDGEQWGENEAFFGAEGQVKISQAGCPLPTVSVVTLHERHLGRHEQPLDPFVVLYRLLIQLQQRDQ